MKTFELLKKRIKNDLDIELWNFERCRPGYWQRANGAWSWRSQGNSPHDYGSQYSAKYLLRNKKSLLLSGTEIIPDE